ncbi:beta-galactosidase 6 [Quercus suber]|uniref:beta-galactosidase n=1 Tax=Quercus suber TaxID=58331 RepID=A0AAW0ISI6_QUESU
MEFLASIRTQNLQGLLGSNYQKYGGKTYIRSAKDIAFQVPLFIARSGSYVNYYMYHGGTNFVEQALQCKSQLIMIKLILMNMGYLGSSSGDNLRSCMMQLNCALQLWCKEHEPTFQLGQQQEAIVFQEENGGCAAFLTNYVKQNVTVQIQNIPLEYSISILLDCKNITFNSTKVKMVYNDRITKSTQTFDSVSSWEEWRDVIVNFEDASLKSNELLEHTNTTKDKSGYLWYTLRFEVTLSCTKPRLHAQSFAHFMLHRIHAGAANGSSNVKYFTMDIPIELNDGMKILVSNKMMGWNQYSEINSFLQQSKNSN